MRASNRLVVRNEGEGEGLPEDGSNLAARAAVAAAGHDRLEIVVRSEIPVGRGLGSSAAVAVAAAAAAGSSDPLAVASRLDGHAENAAASVLGGLVCATFVEGVPVARRLRLDPALGFVLLVPDRPLPTEQARAVLRQEIALPDATFNLGRMGLLIAGLAEATSLTPEATADRLHQDARTTIFPEAPELLSRLLEGGALASCWSGAGSSLLGICLREQVGEVAEAGEAALRTCGIPGTVLALERDDLGLVIERDA